MSSHIAYDQEAELTTKALNFKGSERKQEPLSLFCVEFISWELSVADGDKNQEGYSRASLEFELEVFSLESHSFLPGKNRSLQCRMFGRERE